MADCPSLEIGNSRDFGEVRDRVGRIVAAILPEHDTAYIDLAFDLIARACRGDLAGYRPLLTPYHDQGHVLEVVLCAARLLHGLHLGGARLDALTVDACLVGALLHDSGYLMHADNPGEASGSGAQFTLIHVPRGVVFAETELAGILPRDLLTAVGKVILATDHRIVAVMPAFSCDAERLAAHVTATADLIAQMANREYLERLLLLYSEFREGGIGFFADIHDLLEKTDSFYRMMATRLQNDLGGLAPNLVRHFGKTRGEHRNYYLESIDRNLDYLSRLVREDRESRLLQLKRGRVVEKALSLLDSTD